MPEKRDRTKCIEYEIRCRLFFMRCWKYLMEHPDQSRFYLRFHHSSYYEKYSKDKTTAGRQGLIERIQPKLTKLPDNEGTRILLMQLLDTALNFISRVVSGELSGSDETAESVFRLLFFLWRLTKKMPYRQNRRYSRMYQIEKYVKNTKQRLTKEI